MTAEALSMMSTTQQAAVPEAFTYDDAVSFVRRRFQGRTPKPEQGAPEEEEEPEGAAPEEDGPMWPEDMPEFIDGVPRHLHFPAAIAACAEMQAFLQDTTSPQVRAFSQGFTGFHLCDRLRSHTHSAAACAAGCAARCQCRHAQQSVAQPSSMAFCRLPAPEPTSTQT